MPVPPVVRSALAMLIGASCISSVAAAPGAEFATTDEGIVGTYRRTVPNVDFDTSKVRDERNKPRVIQRQSELLKERYDLSNRPSELLMSGGRRTVQEGVRVLLPKGATWDKLGQLSPAEIKKQDLFPAGFRPLPHVKHETGGMVFPQFEIDEIDKQERRSLQRFDVDFDLPDHFLPEFPAPIFLQMRPELATYPGGNWSRRRTSSSCSTASSLQCRWKDCACC